MDDGKRGKIVNTHCISDRHKGIMVIYDESDGKRCPLCLCLAEGRDKFLWPFEDGSIEEAGFELVNAKTPRYRMNWWKDLILRFSDKHKKETCEWVIKNGKCETGCGTVIDRTMTNKILKILIEGFAGITYCPDCGKCMKIKRI